MIKSPVLPDFFYICIMKIKIRFFASLRDITKQDSINLEIEPQSIASLLELLQNKFPEFNNYGNSIRVAINSEYSAENQQLSDNDEVALIPPTSGG